MLRPRPWPCAQQVADSDRVLIVTPEYNATIPAVINNAIDWLSRPYGAGAIVGKPFGAIGVTPTPYGGKWAHDDARRSAKIAGAHVVEAVNFSQSSLEVDVLTDEQVLSNLAQRPRRAARRRARARRLRNQHDLAGRVARRLIRMGVGHVGQRERPVDDHLEPAGRRSSASSDLAAERISVPGSAPGPPPRTLDPGLCAAGEVGDRRDAVAVGDQRQRHIERFLRTDDVERRRRRRPARSPAPARADRRRRRPARRRAPAVRRAWLGSR